MIMISSKIFILFAETSNKFFSVKHEKLRFCFIFSHTLWKFKSLANLTPCLLQLWKVHLQNFAEMPVSKWWLWTGCAIRCSRRRTSEPSCSLPELQTDASPKKVRIFSNFLFKIRFKTVDIKKGNTLKDLYRLLSKKFIFFKFSLSFEMFEYNTFYSFDQSKFGYVSSFFQNWKTPPVC